MIFAGKCDDDVCERDGRRVADVKVFFRVYELEARGMEEREIERERESREESEVTKSATTLEPEKNALFWLIGSYCLTPGQYKYHASNT